MFPEPANVKGKYIVYLWQLRLNLKQNLCHFKYHIYSERRGVTGLQRKVSSVERMGRILMTEIGDNFHTLLGDSEHIL